MTSATTSETLRSVHPFGGEARDERGGPILLVHGLGGSSANWLGVLPGLRGRRILAPDLPGHGRARPLAGRATADAYVRCLAELIETECGEPVTVVGHSFGGLLAARLALGHPECVRNLVRVAAAGISTTSRATQRYVAVTTRIRPARFVRPLALRLGGRRRVRRTLLGPWFVSDAAALDPRALRAVFQDVHLHADLAAAGRAMVHDDLRAEAAGITCPTVVLWGARDLQLPLSDGFELARRIGAPIRTVPDCGHLLPIERPDTVVDAVREVEEQRPG